ncbi:MAB_1171c family putative transporter [Conyzicola sp.]|uniref:MAB_1171c family putative transporter n=1 Tax=Conyzicola sp. TaxID=1969404 RepID=UPI003989EBF8
MIALVVTAFMWLLFACLLVLRRGRAERNVTYAALTIAFATTLNVDPVYRTLDGLVGGSNLTTLVADLALMCGVFFLGRGVTRAFEHQPQPIRFALSRVALFVTLGCALAAFLLIDHGQTTTNFMLDLGAQPAAAAYSAIQFAYYGIVLTTMAVLAARQFRISEGMQALSPALLVAGSILGVLLSVVVIAMDVAHVAGDLSMMSTIDVVYSPLYLMTFLFLCLGFAGGPAARTAQAHSRERKARMLAGELSPMWAAATKARPGISQNESLAFHPHEPETLLHRQVVEIRDAMIDTRVSFEISDRDRELLERAERHLLGADLAGFTSKSSQATVHHGHRR